MLGQKRSVEINQHIQRHREIIGLELGLIQKQKTHCAPEHTDTHTRSARLGTKSAHRLIFIFWRTHCSGHTVSEDEKHNSPPPVCNLAVNPRPKIKQITKKLNKIHKNPQMVSHGGVRERHQISQKHLLKSSAKVEVCINVSDPGICGLFKHIRLKTID